MIDEVDNPHDRTKTLERRMKAYQEYVKRRGILSDGDFHRLSLEEEDEEVDQD